jgi:hypothetical protein
MKKKLPIVPLAIFFVGGAVVFLINTLFENNPRISSLDVKIAVTVGISLASIFVLISKRYEGKVRTWVLGISLGMILFLWFPNPN